MAVVSLKSYCNAFLAFKIRTFTYTSRRKMKSFLVMFFMRTADVLAQGTLVVAQQLAKFSNCSIWEARDITPLYPPPQTRPF